MTDQEDRRILLVGEANPYGGDPRMALYPLPENASGGRLARILGLSATEYLRAFRRVNLCPTDWSLKEARRRADELRLAGGALVLCGAKVSGAFGYPFEPFAVRAAEHVLAAQPFLYAILPHPSGLSRSWNDPDAPKRARAALARLSELAAGVL